MYSQGSKRWLTVLGCCFVAALALQSLVELVTMTDRHNDFDHAIGVPRIYEGPFDPTRAGIDLDLLPWVLDPVEGWTPEQRQEGAEPCGMWKVLASRYPLWAPATPPNCPDAASAEDQEALGPTMAMNRAGDIILDRETSWELVLEKRGLVARRRDP